MIYFIVQYNTFIIVKSNLFLYFQLGRTALHYAMGVPSVENMSSILIKAGARRIQKDLVSPSIKSRLILKLCCY